MVTVCSIKQVKRNVDAYDKIYLIVRSISSLVRSKSDLIANSKVEQLAALSPSQNLFYKYLDWKKAGEWNKTKFETDYARQFLSEMSNSKLAVEAIYRVKDESMTSNIALCCFCDDASLCHRSIIAGVLKSMGANVILT